MRKFLGEVLKISGEGQSHPRGGAHLPPKSGLGICSSRRDEVNHSITVVPLVALSLGISVICLRFGSAVYSLRHAEVRNIRRFGLFAL